MLRANLRRQVAQLRTFLRQRLPASVALLPLCSLVLFLALTSAAASAEVVDYLCEGEIRTDEVFESDGVKLEKRRFRIVANLAAGYVKRDPALAAGCFAGRTEVCACEPPNAEIIVCRSLGFSADGTEVSLDFTLRASDQRLVITGRRFNARAGSLTETVGRLACQRSPADAKP